MAGLQARSLHFLQYHQPGLETDASSIAHFEGVGRVAYFQGPDGNIHSLAQN